MVKEKVITRTFQFTRAEVKTICKLDTTAQSQWLTVLGVYENDTELLKEVQKILPEDVVPLLIAKKEVCNETRFMTVSDFIKNSSVLNNTADPKED